MKNFFFFLTLLQNTSLIGLDFLKRQFQAQNGMTQIGISRGRRQEGAEGSSSRPQIKSVGAIMQEQKYPKPGALICTWHPDVLLGFTMGKVYSD